MKNGQKSSLYGEVSPFSEEIPYSERFSQIHYREYPLYPLIIVLLQISFLTNFDLSIGIFQWCTLTRHRWAVMRVFHLHYWLQLQNLFINIVHLAFNANSRRGHLTIEKIQKFNLRHKLAPRCRNVSKSVHFYYNKQGPC